MRLLVGLLILFSEAITLICLGMLAGHYYGFFDGISNAAVHGAFTFYIPAVPPVICGIGLVIGLAVTTFASTLRRLLG